MKKKEVMGRRRKIFSAVIATAVIVSSAVPETLLAADFSDSETVVEIDADEQESVAEAEQDLSEEAEVDFGTEDDDITDLDENIEVAGHEHNWSYFLSEDTITATCSGNCEYSRNPLTLSIAIVYAGQDYRRAEVIDNISPVIKGVVGPLTYTGRDGTEYESSTIAPVNAGKYLVSITAGDKTLTKNFDISKKARRFTVSMDPYIWGETVSTPVIGGLDDAVPRTFRYRPMDDESLEWKEWKDITPQTLEPGMYWFQVTTPADDNYFESMVGTLFMVKARPMPEITADDVNVEYDGEPHDIMITGVPEGATVSKSYKKAGEEGDGTTEVPVDAGEYEVSFTVTAPYYEDPGEMTAKITINPRKVTVRTNNVSKTYGEKDPQLTYTADRVLDNENLTDITVAREKGEKVGTYKIALSQKDGANPNYSIEFKNAVFTIKAVELSVKEVCSLKLPTFMAKGTSAGRNVNLNWQKYSGAAGYDIYWADCDGKQDFRKLTTVTNGKLATTHKKLNKKREYKYFVAAYRMVDGNKVYIAKSGTFHVAMKQSKKTNVKSISVNKQKVTLRKGKTFRIKASVKLENKKKKQLSHEGKFRYYAVNSRIASVSKNGTVKAKRKGTTYVYIFANNGTYRRVKVTVK